MPSNDIYTRNDDGDLAVRTVSATESSTVVNPNDVYTRDEDGNLCIRIVGGSGGGVDETKVIVLSDTIPEADASNLGKFYCYKGSTNANYTHGYVYECVAGSAYYEANIAFDRSTFASESFEKAGQLIVDAGVVDPTEVVGGTMTYALAGNLWSIVFTDANGDALNTAYSIYTDDLEQDYDILPVIDPSEFVDGQVVGMAINNVVEHHDYSWERVDLQPAAKLGRYLAGWNCATGLAMTNPPESPYEYTTGDYFIVGVVATGGASNYKPDGSSYTTSVASTTVESESVSVNDTYLYDGANWTLLKTGSTVTSVNGQVGDVTVQETLVSGTNIKTINNQSLLGSGNLTVSGGGIDWAYGWDLSTDAKYDNETFYPACSFDSLPEGTYQMYFMYYNSIDSFQNAVGVLSPDTYCFNFVVYDDNGTKRIGGAKITRVIDGNFTNSYTAETNSGFYFSTATNKYYITLPFYTSCFISDRTDVIKDVAKLTKIKNIQTGVEYNVDFGLYISSELPSVPSPSYYVGDIYLSSAVYIPQYTNFYGNNNGIYVDKDYWGACVIGINSYPTKEIVNNYGSEAVIVFYDENTDSSFDCVISLGINPHYSIKQATGIFENTVIYEGSLDHTLYVKWNFPANIQPHYCSGYVSRQGGNCDNDLYFSDQSSDPQNTIELPRIDVGSSVVLGNIGTISQYTGTTDANYTNGYYYKADGTLIHVPASADIININIQNVTVSIDFETLVPLLVTYTGRTKKEVERRIGDSSYIWRLYGDGNNITDIYWGGAYSIITVSSILACFTVTGWDYETLLTFNTENYVETHDEIQNGHWSQINVQPSSGGSTGTTASLVVANWSNNSQTVNVTGVTANNNVIVAPAPASQSDYTTAGIMCTAQGAGTLTFTCTTVPSSAITVNVLII